MRYPLLVIVLAVSLGTIGCSRSEREWTKATKNNTASGYRSYIAAFPHGPHTIEAQNRLDESEWNTARLTDNIDSYTGYLAAHPTGAHSKDASDEARRLARGVLSMKFKELPEPFLVFC